MGNCFSKKAVDYTGRLSNIRVSIEKINESIDDYIGKQDNDELDRLTLQNEELKKIVEAYGLKLCGFDK